MKRNILKFFSFAKSFGLVSQQIRNSKQFVRDAVGDAERHLYALKTKNCEFGAITAQNEAVGEVSETIFEQIKR